MWEESLKRYDEIVSRCERFERKGKSMPFTSANGYMFSLLNKSGELGIRFSKEKQKQYVEEWDSDLFKSYGATMRGYVLIKEEMFENPDLLTSLLNESFDYVMSLPPK